jgi:very-short-patch-repair endonuclease
MSAPEDALELELKARKLWDGFQREHRFDETRRFRLDFAHLPSKLGLEIQGGQWGRGKSRGKHNRPEGVENDSRKAALAALKGWVVIPFTPRQVNNGEAADFVELWLKYYGEKRA